MPSFKRVSRPNRTDALREGRGDGKPFPFKEDCGARSPREPVVRAGSPGEPTGVPFKVRSRVGAIDPNVLLNSRAQAQAQARNLAMTFVTLHS
ncbi:MAG: hypothetical protein JO235_12190 [Chroococcidiopsidaceae cyanobacterium CP_BM_RX_35]|nr:hypothetical protein [Chroococcidiopsidaceae cyanobacterium CP_BM_RX_35]